MKNFETNPEMLQLLAQKPSAFMKVLFHNRERVKTLLKRSEQMSEDELLGYARRIKPLVRMTDGRKLGVGEECPNSYLVYTTPFDIHDSYYFNFEPEHAVCDDAGDILPVEGLEEIGRFICYHRYGGYWLFVRPGVDEVLQQLPAEFADKRIDAFELKFSHSFYDKVWSSVLDRHVSTVILYALEAGLPEMVKNQDVIIGQKTYCR